MGIHDDLFLRYMASVLTVTFVDKTTLLYFFSALSQCAASFVAIVAVFVVFRLQANDRAIEEQCVPARQWFLTYPASDIQDLRSKFRIPNNLSLGPVLATLPRIDLEEILQKIVDNPSAPGDAKTHARLLRSSIRDRVTTGELIKAALSLPMKLWGWMFLLSLSITPFLQRYEYCSTGLLVVALYSIGAVIALWKTKMFVQDCLRKI